MTPHNSAKKDQIAKIVLMPGDPLRAKYIAENFLENYELVNSVRNMLAYTGYYKGIRLTIMAHGMGNPSIGIYSYELFKFYDVDIIIRIGSCGSLLKEMKLKDIVIASSSISSSPYAYNMGVVDKKNEYDILECSKDIKQRYIDILNSKNIKYYDGLVYASDAFYGTNEVDYIANLKKQNKILCAEMESFALYTNAQLLNKKALTILSVSDSIVNKEELSADERRISFNSMILTALDLVVDLMQEK